MNKDNATKRKKAKALVNSLIMLIKPSSINFDIYTPRSICRKSTVYIKHSMQPQHIGLFSSQHQFVLQGGEEQVWDFFCSKKLHGLGGI